MVSIADFASMIHFDKGMNEATVGNVREKNSK